MENSQKQHECDWFERVVDYAIGVMPLDDRLMFERHLHDCSVCRAELDDLRRAWQFVGLSTSEVEPPAQLKEQVMTAIFGQPAERENVSASVEHRLPNRLWPWVSAAILIIVIVGVIWRVQSTEPSPDLALPGLSHTAVIDKWLPLANEPGIEAGSYGVACIVEQNNEKRLIVYLFGATPSGLDDVYQVWLLDGATRLNGGTFKVNDDGIGVLTTSLKSETSFDQIGITLEPDASGTAPRGPRKFHSAPLVTH